MLYFVIIIAILSFTIIGFSPARAQVNHENPDKLSYQQPYDTYQQLDNDRERMFQAVVSFVRHITTSNFNASQLDVEEFDTNYGGYLNQLALYNNPEPEYNELLPTINEIQTTLHELYDDTRLYSLDLSLFSTFGSDSSLPGGNASSTGLHNLWTKTGQSAGRSKINITAVRSLLKSSNVDMSRLEDSLGLLASYADGSLDEYLQQGRVTGDNYLYLNASASEVSMGGRVDLRLKLAESNVTVAGRLIQFYAGNTTIGYASTDPNGTAVLSYMVGDSDFSNPIRFSARLAEPDDHRIPATSNVFAVWRMPEMTWLTVNVLPNSAVFGDHVRVWGKMTTDKVPVANQTVKISLGERPIGNATTLGDGTYGFDMVIEHFMPAGTSNVSARYESIPGCALLNGSSPGITVALSQSPTAITTDLQPVRCHNGENITFAGSLMAGDAQRPVKGANVNIYADHWLIGNITTDASGSFAASTQIPYNITPGTHGVFVAYEPAEGMVLKGSLSETVPTVFEATSPRLTAGCNRLISFTDDYVKISGAVIGADGKPLAGCPVSIRISGESLGNVTTDASGKYEFADRVYPRLGLFKLTADVAGNELLTNTEVSAGSIFFVPAGRMTTFKLGAAISAGLGCVATAWAIYQRVLRSRRRARRRPAVTAAAVPAVEAPLSYAGKLEGLLRQINADIAAGKDHTGVIASIYIAARLIARSKGIEVSDSSTAGEFRLLFTEVKPPVAPLLNVIIASYEGAAFGHRPLTERNLIDARKCLAEIRKIMGGEGA
ncbi:MAG: hypothetical protein ACM3NG_00175 [Candidatus Doudnabacteria bacterium]